MRIRKCLHLLLLLALVGCQTSSKPGVEIGQKLDSVSYFDVIKANTRSAVRYDGFYQKFEAHVTFMNADVQTALLQKLSDIKQWNEATAQKERDRLFQENATQTKFAISFYVPSARLNDLHKANSIWEIYLESEGKRYDGKAQRRNGKLEDFQAMLPHHNRWSTVYDITFDVPLSGVETSKAYFVITSSQGSAKLEF